MHLIENFKEDYLIKASKLYVSAFNKDPWNEHWSFKTAYIRLNEVYNTPNFKGFVFIENNNIISVILGNFEQWDKGIKYSLKEFFVDPCAQGKGIGSNMLSFLEEYLKKKDISFVELYTVSHSKAQKFYEKMQYKPSNSLLFMTKDLK